MTIMRFTDGITIDTSGPLRPLRLYDGWYVVGQGYLIPVASLEEAQTEIAKMARAGRGSAI